MTQEEGFCAYTFGTILPEDPLPILDAVDTYKSKPYNSGSKGASPDSTSGIQFEDSNSQSTIKSQGRSHKRYPGPQQVQKRPLLNQTPYLHFTHRRLRRLTEQRRIHTRQEHNRIPTATSSARDPKTPHTHSSPHPSPRTHTNHRHLFPQKIKP